MADLILAFDYGLKHIGVAVGQSITRSASPLTTLRARNGEPDWEEIRTLVQQWKPARLIVGLPLNMDDSESDMSENARRFADKLVQHTGVEVSLVDERLTSFEARGIEDSDNHAIAAALIAQSWLES